MYGFVRIDNDGRTIWDVFRQRRFLGNSRADPCSDELKRKPMRRWLEATCEPDATVVYLGYDWTEGDRIANGAGYWAPWYVENPLMWELMLDKQGAIDACYAAGIEPPLLTRQGYPHANCGGGCVKAGAKQFRKLLLLDPEEFGRWEANEREFQEFIGRPVTMLRDRRGGKTRPLPLTEIRERVEAVDDLFPDHDWGACSCITPTAAEGDPAPAPTGTDLHHVVMVSSGTASAVAAKRVAERYGTERLSLLFADVNGEHPDNYRFLDEVVRWVLG